MYTFAELNLIFDKRIYANEESNNTHIVQTNGNASPLSALTEDSITIFES